MVINHVAKGSCVSRGGTASYKTKLKSLYIRTAKCPIRHKNLDYWHLFNKYSPKTQNFDVFCTSWMKSLIKMRNLNNWPTFFSAVGKKKALSLKILIFESKPIIIGLGTRFEVTFASIHQFTFKTLFAIYLLKPDIQTVNWIWGIQGKWIFA